MTREAVLISAGLMQDTEKMCRTCGAQTVHDTTAERDGAEQKLLQQRTVSQHESCSHVNEKSKVSLIESLHEYLFSEPTIRDQLTQLAISPL